MGGRWAEEGGTGIVHDRGPAAGAESRTALGKKLGLPMIAPLGDSGIISSTGFVRGTVPRRAGVSRPDVET